MVRLDKSIADLAEQFVLVRILNARGLNLHVFDFDYDLDWAGLFMNADEQVYGRYGGRDADSPDRYLTIPGLRHAMKRALAAHASRAPTSAQGPASKPETVEDYPGLKRLSPTACIHCHQVYDFRREVARTAGRWQLRDLWVYPTPDTLGFAVDPEQGDRVQWVTPGSAAEQAGLRAQDLLLRIQGSSIASFADVQYALHGAPDSGTIPVRWQRGSQLHEGAFVLRPGWRETDISWRASSRRLGPPPGVQGEDLNAREKAGLGLAADRLAFRQQNFVSKVARQAGIRQNDIIVGVDQKKLRMSVQQFAVYMRLNYAAGDRVVYQILRDGRPMDIELNLPQSTP